MRDIQEGKNNPSSVKHTTASSGQKSLQLSFYDRSHGLGKVSFSRFYIRLLIKYYSAIDTDGLTCQSRDQRMWNGARSTMGVKGTGRL